VFRAFFLLLAAVVPISTGGQTNAAAYRHALIETWQKKHPSAAIAVAFLDKRQIDYSFGGTVSTTDTNAPTLDTLFEIGSITKGFTGLLLADQILAGKASGTNTLAQLLTNWRGRSNAPAGQITLESLATHRSGLPRLPGNMGLIWLIRYSDDPYAAYDEKRLYEWLDGAPLDAAKGEYSNAGFGILGHALAVSGGRTYEELLRDRILVPLGMTNTTITLSPSQRVRLAQGHHGSKLASSWNFQALAGAGALRSSLRDMTHFLQMMAGVSANPLGDVCALATESHASEGTGKSIGFGWARSEMKQGVLIWHNGGTGGYSSCIAWVAKHKVGVVVLAAADDGDETTELAFDLLRPPPQPK
jgi:D-alanyl-D-alanine-carboxypeptidase/D-alanyl-D-alanine-endopeptidase